MQSALDDVNSQLGERLNLWTLNNFVEPLNEADLGSRRCLR